MTKELRKSIGTLNECCAKWRQDFCDGCPLYHAVNCDLEDGIDAPFAWMPGEAILGADREEISVIELNSVLEAIRVLREYCLSRKIGLCEPVSCAQCGIRETIKCCGIPSAPYLWNK